MSVIILRDGDKNFEKSFTKIFSKLNFPLKDKVFIKPNFSGRAPIIPGENTDPEFLKSLVSFLSKNGVKDIIVGHGALLGIPEKKITFEEMIVGGGFAFLKKMPNVSLVNLDTVQREIIKSGEFSFSIPKILKEVDGYINLAKLKTHMETVVSLSIKNQMGLVSMIDRVNMHRNDLDGSLAYLAKAIKPDINIIDGLVAMEGNGPHNGTSIRINLLLAGDDMVETDSVTSFLIGIDFKTIKHIFIAKNIGVGEYPTEEFIHSIREYKVSNFKRADYCKKYLKNIYVWPTKSCSRCITILNEFGKFVKRRPLKNLKFIKKGIFGDEAINIVIGRADELKLNSKEKIIAIGSCTKTFCKRCSLNNLDKCPPSVTEVAEYIKKEIDNK